MSLSILSKEEAEKLYALYFSKSVKYRYGVCEDGFPAFLIPKGSLVVDDDGTVTWRVREIGLGLHSFLEVSTGEKRQKDFVLPLCLVNPETRSFIGYLLETTRSLGDGQYNSQPAEFILLTTDGIAVKVKAKLESLAMHYFMLQIFPEDFAEKYKTRLCPFCGGF